MIRFIQVYGRLCCDRLQVATDLFMFGSVFPIHDSADDKIKILFVYFLCDSCEYGMRSSAGRALDSKSKSRRFKSGRVQTNNLEKSYWLLQSFLQFVTRYFKRFGIKSLKIVEIICPNPKLPKLLLFFNHTPLHPPPPSGRILQYY